MALTSVKPCSAECVRASRRSSDPEARLRTSAISIGRSEPIRPISTTAWASGCPGTSSTTLAPTSPSEMIRATASERTSGRSRSSIRSTSSTGRPGSRGGTTRSTTPASIPWIRTRWPASTPPIAANSARTWNVGCTRQCRPATW